MADTRKEPFSVPIEADTLLVDNKPVLKKFLILLLPLDTQGVFTRCPVTGSMGLSYWVVS
ncbi:hypothetical protein [Paraflavitalea speifideaquila]|uniref:hypothetical protein n=1 Tax=Paraflavitalea speifideaquila TaxID=3076558 RepID=UPI0028E96149|nr:hypothetical protein [Paraflavitalea speifideiaquila]